MKLLYLSVDGKNIGEEFPKILTTPIKDYFTPEVEDPIWEFQFEEDFSIYAMGSSIVFAVQGDIEAPEESNKPKIVGLKGRERREEEKE